MPKKRMVRPKFRSAAPSPARPWPAPTLAFDDPQRVLRFALVASLLLHAIVLSIKFRLPEMALNKMRDSQLEVVLVNAKSTAKPEKPQARAQASLDGGGNTDENRRARTPLPAVRDRPEGTEIIEAQQRQRELEIQQQKLLAQAKSALSVPAETEKAEQPDRPVEASGRDLAQTALAMARFEAEIARNIDAYNKRPRKKFIGARVSEAIDAMYAEQWRQKVERVGNLNYPEAVRGRVYGSLVLTVGIRADGELESVEVNRSSGHKLLDEAALRIVRLAAPFGRFSEDMKRAYDILVITRTWTFTTTDKLASE